MKALLFAGYQQLPSKQGAAPNAAFSAVALLKIKKVYWKTVQWTDIDRNRNTINSSRNAHCL